MKAKLVPAGSRGLASRGHRVELYWTGAEVPALYRMYLARYGAHDAATGDAFVAAVNRHDYTENLDLYDAREVADAFEGEGLPEITDHIRSVVGWR